MRFPAVNILPGASFGYKIFFFFVSATIAVLPFHKIFASFPLTFACMAALLTVLFSARSRGEARNPTMLLWCLLFISFVPGFIIAHNQTLAWQDLSGKLYLFVTPLLFFFIKPPGEIAWQRLLHLFVFACLVFIAVSIGIAVSTFAVSGVSHFFYKDLVGFSTIHPSYLGMYINFAIAITGVHFFRDVRCREKKRRTMYIVILAVLFVYLLLLTAKTAIIIGGISLIWIFIYWGKQQGKLKRALAYLFLAFILLASIALANNEIRVRIGMLFNYDKVNYDNSVLSRQYQWMSAWQLINDSHWRGVGSDISTDKLIEYYAKNNFQKGVEERYNTHNQYLQAAVDGGWLSLVLFCASLAALLLVAFWSRKYILFFFLLILCISNLTECMFETLSGILFFALFGALLAWEKPVAGT